MKFLTTVTMLFSATVLSGQVRWMSMEEALSAQKINPRKIMIHFYDDGCAPCKEMEKLTYGQPEIWAMLNANYYAVKFNTESTGPVAYMGRTFTNTTFGKKHSKHSFSAFMNIRSVPAAVILDGDATLLTGFNGFLTARELEPYLDLFSGNKYKSIKTRDEWDAYQNKFKTNIQ